jgi:hypothetical protein
VQQKGAQTQGAQHEAPSAQSVQQSLWVVVNRMGTVIANMEGEMIRLEVKEHAYLKASGDTDHHK